jgi:hypothetical protein
MMNQLISTIKHKLDLDESQRATLWLVLAIAIPLLLVTIYFAYFLYWRDALASCPPACQKTDLRLANLPSMGLRQADLREANLRQADLTGAILKNADLSLANLEGVILSETQRREAILSSNH